MMAHLNYNPLSLKNMAIRRLAASFRNLYSNFWLFDDYHEEVWRETSEDKLPDEISKLGLPKSLKKLLIDTFKPMGRLVGRWKEFHKEYLYDSYEEEIHFELPILEKLCWTAAGAVDYPKTAEELMRSDVIDIAGRYKLACLYCLEDYIPLFWKQLPKEYKMYFCGKIDHRVQSGGLGLEFWWPYIIEGQESDLDDLTRSYRGDQVTFHQYAFQCSAEKGNKTAAEYFFRKLTHEEKEASLMSTTRALLASRYTTRNPWDKEFPREKFSELLSYLLFVMTPDQQRRIFQEQPCKVLSWFLEWPSQDIFSEIADLISVFLPERDYDSVLKVMHNNFKKSGDHCIILFQELLLRIPRNFRKSFVDRECEFGSFFDDILSSQDIKALEIFFRSVDAASRKRIVFSELALKYFYNFISSGTWDVVEVCLREANLSEEDRERLKEAFMRYLTSIEKGELKLEARKCTRFFDLLDETNDPSERCSKDETPSEAPKQKT